MINPIQTQAESLKHQITEAMQKAIRAKELPSEKLLPFIVEIPADPSNGDFASNCALVHAKAFHMPPRDIAQIVLGHLHLEKTSAQKAETAGAGFINFFMKDEWFSEVIATILKEKENYGKSDFGKNQKTMIEFVSANPTGPMHVGNARGGAIGNCLAHILSYAGYRVFKEFYINDAGNQIEKFALSLDVRYRQHFEGKGSVSLPEDAYQGQDIIESAEAFAAVYGDSYLKKEEKERKNALIAFALPKNIEQMKTDLSAYRVSYDVWFHESTLYQEGYVQKVISLLTQKGHTYEKEGALWLRSREFGCEKDDVLIRENGIPTYFAADIAYHYHKFCVRGFEKVINIWGADHHGHVARLKGALQALGISPDRLVVILMQMVRLMKDGEPVKVSKRTGKSITLKTLLDEIPTDAACFFFNLRDPNSHFDVDLDLAISNTSENPVYYVQYAHARICSILKKLKEEGVASSEAASSAPLHHPEEKALARKLALFPNEILEAAQQYNPAKMTGYAIELAAAFHKFYNACPIKGSQPPVIQARLRLCHAVKIVLKSLCSLLSIAAPESM